jgi:hypothetical protein
MNTSETVHAEPRDFVDAPSYRVNFWQRSGEAWSLDAFVLTDVADIADVLRWVDQHALGRRFEVFAEIDDEPVWAFKTPRTSALVRLLGSNPNAGEPTEIGRFVRA